MVSRWVTCAMFFVGVSGVSRCSGADPVIATRALRGLVVGADGDPVAGARFIPQRYRSTEKVTDFVADEEGRFELVFDSIPSTGSSNHFWIVAPGHGIRVIAPTGLLLRSGPNKDLKVVLPPLDPVTVQLFGPDEQPLRDATVRPYYVNVPNGRFMADEPTGLTDQIPAELEEMLTVEVDADGKAELDQIPRNLLSSIQVSHKNHGSQIFDTDFRKEPLNLSMLPSGSIQVKILTKDPSSFAGQTIYLNQFRSKKTVQFRGTDFRVHAAQSLTLDESGIAKMKSFPIGIFRVSFFQKSGDDPGDILERLVVEGEREVYEGETTFLRLRSIPTVEVVGKVVTEKTDQPVRGTRISIRDVDERLSYRTVSTDSEGVFRCRVVPGRLSLQAIVLSSDRNLFRTHEYPPSKRVTIEDDRIQQELEPFVLPAKSLVMGQLIDEQGDPVANAMLQAAGGRSPRFPWAVAKTDEHGVFKLWIGKRGRRTFDDASWYLVEDDPASALQPTKTPLEIRQKHQRSLILVLLKNRDQAPER